MSDDSRGRAVLLAHERGALWTADLHGITWVESLPGPVASAAFDDANRGAAVLRDGALHETRDGGRRGDASLSGLTSRCASRTTGARCASPRTGRGSPSTPGA